MTKPETKAKHTPGPWEAQACQVISLRNRFQVCDTYRGNKADARLIAAAPELLEAAKEGLIMVNELIEEELSGTRFYKEYMKRLETIKNAIAKAEGSNEKP